MSKVPTHITMTIRELEDVKWKAMEAEIHANEAVIAVNELLAKYLPPAEEDNNGDD